MSIKLLSDSEIQMIMNDYCNGLQKLPLDDCKKLLNMLVDKKNELECAINKKRELILVQELEIIREKLDSCKNYIRYCDGKSYYTDINGKIK